MTAQEKQTMLHDLQVVTGIFREFEEACNMVASLPGQRRAVYNEVDVPDQVKAVASKGSTVLVTIVAYIILIIPSVIVAGIISAILRLTQHVGLMLLIAIVINAIGAKYLGGIISRKIQAGGGKLQDAVNRQIRSSNQAATVHNAEVERRLVLAQQRVDAVREKIRQMDMSWYPVSYHTSNASAFFYDAFLNGKCDSMKEAVNLYDQYITQNRMLANQMKQIDLLYQQCILQEQTIAAIHYEGAATRETIRDEGAQTRQTIWQSGEYTRETIRDEGARTRETIHAEGEAARRQQDWQYRNSNRF